MTYRDYLKNNISFTSHPWMFYTPHVFIFILPFIMFYWMIPFVSHQTLGNDYQMFPIHHQIELMFSLKTGSFPLYVPGFAGGQSSSALTLGQIFHPISHISAFMPKYWNGRALEWNTLFRLLSLGGVHLLLFRFLRALQTNRLMALIISTVTIYNLRMLDLFRYGASLESWTGHLLLCIAIGNLWFKKKWTAPLCVVGATYWLICSGHPQMMYYGLLGAGLFALTAPYFLSMMVPSKSVNIKTAVRFYLKTGLYITIGICLSSAYTFPFYFDFILNSAGRIAQDYAWADTYRDTFIGTVNNFFFSLRSDMHGAFGGSSLILVAALIPVLSLFKVKIPRVIWTIWCIIVILFLHMQGSRFIIHLLTWEILPFASSFRIAGRISLILPVFFMLILSWLVRGDLIKLNFMNRVFMIPLYVVISVIAIICMGIFCIVPSSIFPAPSFYSAISIRHIPKTIELFIFGLGIGTLSVFGIYGIFHRIKFVTGILLTFFMILQIIGLLQYGTWIEPTKKTPSFANMLSDKQKKLDYNLSIGFGSSSTEVAYQAKRSFLEPFLGRIYKDYSIAENNEDAYDKMAKNRLVSQVVIESCPPPKNILNKKKSQEIATNHVKLTYSSFNYLTFKVQAVHAGFFGLSYPYSKNWKAFVNDQETRVYRANGAAHAIWIPRGVSKVSFYYKSPAAFYGMLISCVTLILIGVFLGLKANSHSIGIIMMIGCIISGVAVFLLWYQSLYNGNNLGTNYEWTGNRPSDLQNIAYGKLTKMSSHLFDDYPYLYSSGRAVDQERTPGTGFITGRETNPWWMVDLGSDRRISYIIIYEGMTRPYFNTRPINIEFSQDGKIWQRSAIISDQKYNNSLKFKFEKKPITRFIRIMSSGICHLSLDEVEVIP